ncbi:MAG: hypothetical protein WC655_03640 [Candidatus Hydrogenedentales bacterium]|jgi:hypothetical protein
MRRRGKKSKAEFESRALDVIAWCVLRLICGIVGFLLAFFVVSRSWVFFAEDDGPTILLGISAVSAVFFVLLGPRVLSALFEQFNDR